MIAHRAGGTGRAGPCRGDEGATVIIFTLMTLPLLILTALVIDLGLARVTSERLKATSDMAAVAAGFFLAGDGSASPVSNPMLACSAAFTSMKANLPDLPAAATLSPTCASNFTDNAVTCVDGLSAKHTSTSQGSGAYTVRIEYPLPASDIADERLLGSAGVQDGSSSCARMRVSVERKNPPVFGSVIGNKGLILKGSSVVKAGLSPNGVAAPAILLLERSNCGTLVTTGQGAVKVKGAVTSGGWIHSDSAGGGVGSLPGNNCQGGASCNGNNFTIAGSALPSGAKSIVAETNGSSDTPGKIATYALAPRINGAGGCNYPAGLNVAPTADPLVARTPVDLRYNSEFNQTGMTISSLHAAGYAATTGGPPAGYGVVAGSACGQDNTVWQAANVYIQCAGGFTGKNVVFRASNVILTGPLSVAGGYVAFPNVRQLYVRGCPTCAEAIKMSSNGLLSINSGEAVNGKWSLVGTLNLAADGVAGGAPANWPTVNCIADRSFAPNPTTLASFGGAFVVQNATANICQTFTYLGTNTPTYVQASATVGGNCTTSFPCPSATPPTAPVFAVNSGSSPAVSWTAPYQNLSGTSVASPFDGLLVWTEGGGSACSIAGQGALSTSGVFFMPNCNFTYAGQADGNIPLAAQFIVRTLTMSGQGVLSLQPDSKHSIAVSSPGTVQLVR